MLFVFVGAEISQRSIDDIEKKYGIFAANRFRYYNKLLRSCRDKNSSFILKSVNDFWNIMKYKSDLKIWKKKDYWATPYEMLLAGAGDCEDYVIAKYYTLRKLGIDPVKLYFVFAKIKNQKRTHMVLAYCPSVFDEPVILDNINNHILAVSKRKDLTPIYYFNSKILMRFWKYKEKKRIEAKKIKLKWKSLKRRVIINPLQ